MPRHFLMSLDPICRTEGGHWKARVTSPPLQHGFGDTRNVVSDQKVVACLADLGGCDTVTRGPSISGSVENLFGYDAAAEFPQSDWAVCR